MRTHHNRHITGGGLLACLLVLSPSLTPIALAEAVKPKAVPAASLAGRAPKALPAAARWSRTAWSEGVVPLGRLGFEALRLASSPPAMPPTSGSALPWQPAFGVYKGSANLATGNLTLAHAVTGWTARGPGVSLGLVYNSQGAGTAATVGPRWNHSYSTRIVGTSPAVLVRADGRELTYNLVGGAYVAPAGFQETLVRNGNGTWTLTFKDGSTQSFDATGRLTALTDANLNATTLTYTGTLLTSVTDAAGRSLTLGYVSGRLTTVTDPEARVWTLGYDGSGRLTGVTDPILAGVTSATTFAYDATNRVTGVTDRLNKTWTYSYGPNGVFGTVVDPLGQTAGAITTTEVTLDLNGFTSADQSTAGGGDTPDAQPVTYPVGTVATAYLEDPSGAALEYGVDAQGRVTAQRDGSGHQTNFTWDAANNRTAVVAPDGATTTMAYDARANATTVTDPTGKTTTRVYDARNNATSVTDPAGRVTTSVYDLRNNLLSTTDPTNRTTSQTVNLNGTVATSTDPAGKITTYAYNTAGDVTGVTDPLGATTSTVYALGRPTSRTDALNRTTTYAYDAWKRPTGVDYPVSTDQSFVYDREGRMTSSVDGTGTRTYAYDALGRKTTQTDPRGTTLATYDPAGRLQTQTDVTGRAIGYAYDGDGALTGVSDPVSSATYLYDTRHRLVKTTYHTGVRSEYTYDAAGRTLNLTHKQANGTLIASYATSYDAAGRMAQTTEGPVSVAATTTYGYDFAGRLTSENRTGNSPYASTYTYDSRGLRATAFRSENGVTSHNGSYVYDDAGRLTSVADTATGSNLGGTYAWNADGTLASMPGQTAGTRRTMTYDEEGRLTAISRLQGGVTTALFQYGYGFDGGRRWRKDLAGGVQDWYPCGVACCAGELVTLRSTNNGATWTTLETKLVKGGAAMVDGTVVLLGGKGGRRVAAGVSSDLVVDAFGMRRWGSFSLPTTSVLRSTKDDLSLESSAIALGGGGNAEQGDFNCVKESRDSARTAYPGSTKEQNAMRHCVGACKIAKKCPNEQWALTAKETWDMLHDYFDVAKPHGGDTYTDNHNNNAGFKLGLSGVADCGQACQRSYNSGGLR